MDAPTPSNRLQGKFRLWMLFGLLALCWLVAPDNPAWSYLLLYIAFLAHLMFTRNQLPDRIATHFNGDMRPDGWMSRRAYLIFVPAFVAVISLAPLGVALWLHWHASPLANWVAWPGCMLLGFLFGTHVLVVDANRNIPTKLSGKKFYSLLGALGLGLLLWLGTLTRPLP